ncbi:MAG: hypothetical protein AMXMBFR33_09550 [Candidatus Xenobia bacterium]
MSDFFRRTAEQLKKLLKECEQRYQVVESEVEALESGPNTPELETKTRELEQLESLREGLEEALSYCD